MEGFTLQVIGQRDPWQPYGKGKGHNVTPEPGAYGVLFIAICLSLVLLRGLRRRN
jgi:hypothetical protein